MTFSLCSTNKAKFVPFGYVEKKYCVKTTILKCVQSLLQNMLFRTVTDRIPFHKRPIFLPSSCQIYIRKNSCGHSLLYGQKHPFQNPVGRPQATSTDVLACTMLHMPALQVLSQMGVCIHLVRLLYFTCGVSVDFHVVQMAKSQWFAIFQAELTASLWSPSLHTNACINKLVFLVTACPMYIPGILERLWLHKLKLWYRASSNSYWNTTPCKTYHILWVWIIVYDSFIQNILGLPKAWVYYHNSSHSISSELPHNQTFVFYFTKINIPPSYYLSCVTISKKENDKTWYPTVVCSIVLI